MAGLGIAVKHIWLPSTETKATVTQDGTVNVWDEMSMELKPLTTQSVGFPAKPEEKKA